MFIFKLINPFPDEINCRYKIVDDRCDEVLVQEIEVCKNLSLKPMYQFKKTELIPV